MIVLGRDWKKRSQEPCTQPQASVGWWSLDFLQTTRVWQSWVCARQEHDAFCEILDLSVPICKWEVGISPQIHSGSAFPCFPSYYPDKLTELFLPGRKKQWGLSSLYSGSNVGPNCSISIECGRCCTEWLLCKTLSHEVCVLCGYHSHKPHLFLDLGGRMGFLL